MKKIVMLMTFAAILLNGVVYASEKFNLLRNPEFKIDDKGKVLGWIMVGADFTALLQSDGRTSMKCVVIDKQVILRSTNLTGLKPGKYVFSASVKLDNNIHGFLFCLILLDTDTKKELFEYTECRTDLPKIGEWGKVIVEFTIPEGIQWASIAFDLRQKQPPPVTVEIAAPKLTYKAE